MNQYKHWLPALVCLALASLTIAAFWQIKDCGFIDFDDNIYVYSNAYVQSGLDWNSVGQAFSYELATKIGFWHPITWMSLMLDYSIFGLNPSGYHVTNLLFHVLSTILLFLILRRMTKALWPSAFVATLFAIHPLHVESVAWIAERKDVLSTFFWILTMGAYSYYVEQKNFKRYSLVLLFFILGLMSKPMLITLPFVLLLLDYWPLQRFQEITPGQEIQAERFKSLITDKQNKKSKNKYVKKDLLEVKKPSVPQYKWSLIYPWLWEKVPLFAMTILFSIITYLAELKVGAIHSESFPLIVRIGNAVVTYIVYIGKMVWPINLAVFYPHPGNVVLWQVLSATFLLMAITAVVTWRVKKMPYLVTGWLWYIGTLVPVIGIVKVGDFAKADRYTYIPLIGLFIIIAWGVPALLRKWKYRKEILLLSSVASILCLTIITWQQVWYWQNSFTLFDHTLKVTDDNWYACDGRGAAHSGLGNYRQAIEDYSRAIKIKPDYANAYNNRGTSYHMLGSFKQAIEDYGRAIGIKPDYTEAYFNRANTYNVLGHYRQAIEDYDRAVEIKSDYADAYTNRGVANNGLGNFKQAIEDFSKAIAIKPNYMEAYTNRGVVYAKLGSNNLAVDDLKMAAQLGDERAKRLLQRNGISSQH